MNDESLSALLDGECSPAEVERLLAAMDRDPALRQRFSRLCLARDACMGTRIRAADPGFAARVAAALDAEPEPALPGPVLTRWAPAAAAAVLAVAALLVWHPSIEPPARAESRAVAVAAAGEVPAEYLLAHSQPGARLGGALGYARYAAHAARPAVRDD
jgi:negative regulator of sigma E activity